MKKHLYLNQDYLKLLALFTMTLDHMGKILFVPTYEPLTIIGRTAFPIFSYLIMLHLFEKKCFKKYFIRLFGFGFVTSALLVYQNQFPDNILWPFFVAVACIWLMDRATVYFKNADTRLGFQIAAFVFCFAVSFGMDYSIFGFCYLLSLYGFFKYKTPLFVVLCLIFGGLINPSSVVGASVSIVTTGILLLNDPHGPNKRHIHSKWLFYIYYPAHLTVLYTLKSLGLVF